MEKLKIWFKNYLNKNSNWKIAGDVLFYLFIVLLLIPATRKPISTTLIRLTMIKPRVDKSADLPAITEADKAFEIEDFHSNVYSLDDFDDEVVLLNFWATWCPPCRAEMPSLQKLNDDYGDKIAILLVTSEEKEVVREYLDQNNYDLPVYFQRSALPPTMKVSSIPTTFLIGRNDRIYTEKKGAANWNSGAFRDQLDQLISAKP